MVCVDEGLASPWLFEGGTKLAPECGEGPEHLGPLWGTACEYRLRQANIDIVHLVHKSGLTITPVIAFLKKKGVAVQPGDEAIGDWAGDSTFFEIVASNYKQYKAYKELEDEKQRLQDENKRLEEDNQKLRKDKEAEIQRLRDENLGFKGLEEEVQRLRAEVQQAQKDKEENQRLVLKGALSQKLASASTHAVTCRQHIPQARSQLRTPNMSSKSMGLHAPIHPMTVSAVTTLSSATTDKEAVALASKHAGGAYLPSKLPMMSISVSAKVWGLITTSPSWSPEKEGVALASKYAGGTITALLANHDGHQLFC
eukprot:gene19192-25809_t